MHGSGDFALGVCSGVVRLVETADAVLCLGALRRPVFRIREKTTPQNIRQGLSVQGPARKAVTMDLRKGWEKKFVGPVLQRAPSRDRLEGVHCALVIKTRSKMAVGGAKIKCLTPEGCPQMPYAWLRDCQPQWCVDIDRFIAHWRSSRARTVGIFFKRSLMSVSTTLDGSDRAAEEAFGRSSVRSGGSLILAGFVIKAWRRSVCLATTGQRVGGGCVRVEDWLRGFFIVRAFLGPLDQAKSGRPPHFGAPRNER